MVPSRCIRALLFDLVAPAADGSFVFPPLSEAGLRRLLALADREQVLLPAADALARGGVVLPAPWPEAVERRRSGRQERLAVALDLSRRLGRLGLSHLFLKGFGTEAAYGQGYLRQFGDLDLAVPGLAELWQVAAVGLDRGFRLASLVIRRCPDSRVWSGLAVLEAASAIEPEEGVCIEIMAGAQPLFWTTAAQFHRQHWQGKELRAAGGSLAVPCPEHAVLIQLGEHLERTRLRLRDLWDFRVLTKSFPSGGDGELDGFRSVERQARRLGLGREIARCRRALRRSRRGARGAIAGRQEGVSGLLASLRRIAEHTVPVTAATHGAWRAMTDGGRTALLEVVHRHLPPAAAEVVRTRLGRHLSPARWRDRGFHLQALPVDGVDHGAFRWQETAAGPRVLTPVGTFVPSVFAAGDQIAAAPPRRPVRAAVSGETGAGLVSLRGETLTSSQTERAVRWALRPARHVAGRILGDPVLDDETSRRVLESVRSRFEPPLAERTEIFAATSGGRWLALAAATEGVGWWGLPTGALHLLAARRSQAGRARMDRLVDAAARAGRSRGWSVLEARVPFAADPCFPQGWDHAHALVSKSLGDPAEPPGERPPGVSIRVARPDDDAFLCRAIADALLIGLSECERALVSARAVRRRAEALLASVLAEGLVLVADLDGRPVGVATAQLVFRHPVTGLLHARLLDAWTAPAVRGMGIARDLVRRIEGVAARFGARTLLATARRPSWDATVGLVRELEAFGWRPVESIWRTPLGPAPVRQPSVSTR